MRKFVFIAVAALSCASLAQEAKVTYTCVAASAKKAIADLAQKSGMNIQCAPAMEREILILRLEDAPMSEVMKQIAAVTSGTWRKEGEISYLVADSSARQIEANKKQQQFANKLAASLKKQQEAMTKQGKEPKGAPDEAAMFGFMGGGDSASMTKLAIAIGSSQLALVPEDGRVVFSTNPNGMQKSLPGSANAIISEFVAEHNKKAALVKQDEPAKNDNEEMAAFMELFAGRMKKPKPITSAPAKALVIASRRGMFMGYTLELKLYDANGKVLANSTSSLMTDMPFDPREFANPKAPPPSQGAEIKLSALSKEMAGVNGSFSMGGGAGNMKLSKDLMEALKDPVERDPLSFVHSEALIEIAKQRKEQLVANMPDSVMSFFGNLTPKGQLTVDSYLTEIKGEDKAAVTEANGWMIVAPASPVDARKERTDRTSLRDLIRIAQSQGSVGLDDLAAYAVKNANPMEDAPASTMYVMVFAPNALQQGMMGIVNWDMLRFYGMLDSSQRQSLRQGGRIAFGSLTPGQQGQVNKMLFGADENLVIEARPRPNEKKQDPFTEMVMNQMQRFGGGGNENDFRTEPTEIMPNGLPQNGFVVVNFTSDPIGQPQTISSDFGRGMGLGPIELGMFKLFKEDPKLSAVSGQMPTIDDIKVGTRSTYNFSFFVAPDVCEKQMLHDDKIAKDAQVYKMSNLPPDFQKRIDDMAASLKNNPLWKMVGAMGGMNQKVMPPQ